MVSIVADRRWPALLPPPNARHTCGLCYAVFECDGVAVRAMSSNAGGRGLGVLSQAWEARPLAPGGAPVTPRPTRAADNLALPGGAGAASRCQVPGRLLLPWTLALMRATEMVIVAKVGSDTFIVGRRGRRSLLAPVRIVDAGSGRVSHPVWLGSVLKFMHGLEPMAHDPALMEERVRPVLKAAGVRRVGRLDRPVMGRWMAAAGGEAGG